MVRFNMEYSPCSSDMPTISFGNSPLQKPSSMSTKLVKAVPILPLVRLFITVLT